MIDSTFTDSHSLTRTKYTVFAVSVFAAALLLYLDSILIVTV